jgi:phage FluMu gp28-like protein
MISANGVVTEEVTLSNIEKERLVNHLAMLIEQETISYPDNEVLLNELKDYQYSYTKTGKISFSASSYNKHDDLVIAMVLAFKDYNMPGVVLPFMGMVEGIKKKKTRTA